MNLRVGTIPHTETGQESGGRTEQTSSVLLRHRAQLFRPRGRVFARPLRISVGTTSSKMRGANFERHGVRWCGPTWSVHWRRLHWWAPRGIRFWIGGALPTYFRSSGIIGYGWRMFDQILFSPSVMDVFRDFEVEILRKAGDNDLVDHRELPNSTSASDHLPIRVHFFEKSLP